MGRLRGPIYPKERGPRFAGSPFRGMFHAVYLPPRSFEFWQRRHGKYPAAARTAAASSTIHAYLQLGQDTRAKTVIDEMTKVTGFSETLIAGPYALAVSPARYAIERGDWKAAAELQVRPTPLAHVEAITHFARALGAARSGNPEAAKADIAKLGELRNKLRDAKDAYWSGQVDIQAQVASTWVLYAEGKYDGALKAMSAAPRYAICPRLLSNGQDDSYFTQTIMGTARRPGHSISPL